MNQVLALWCPVEANPVVRPHGDLPLSALWSRSPSARRRWWTSPREYPGRAGLALSAGVYPEAIGGPIHSDGCEDWEGVEPHRGVRKQRRWSRWLNSEGSVLRAGDTRPGRAQWRRSGARPGLKQVSLQLALGGRGELDVVWGWSQKYNC